MCGTAVVIDLARHDWLMFGVTLFALCVAPQLLLTWLGMTY